MSFTDTVPLRNFPAGLTLHAQLYVIGTGVNSGSAITTGFVEIASGDYDWTNTFTTDSDWGVKFYDASNNYLGSAIVPQPQSASIWSSTTRTLTSGTITIVTPWQTGTLNVIKGDSYLTSDDTALEIIKTATAIWPSDLLSAGDYTITFTATPTGKTEADTADYAAALSSTGNVIDAMTVDLGDITAAQTATLTQGANAYTYTVVASRLSDTIVHTLEEGVLTVG